MTESQAVLQRQLVRIENVLERIARGIEALAPPQKPSTGILINGEPVSRSPSPGESSVRPAEKR